MTTFTRNFLAGCAFVAAFVSTTAIAAPITDVKEYSNNAVGEYFVKDDASKTDLPYYRRQNDDWEWQHTAIGGTFSSILLDISAFDVDFESLIAGEVDYIYVFTGTNWFNLGNLAGANDVWAFSSFDLSGFSWANDQVNAGLKVRMDIDVLREGWAVALGKSTLSLDGGNQTCVPTPGVPCNPTVSEPMTLGLFGLALFGLSLRRKKAKNV
jgi:hypothetical protein